MEIFVILLHGKVATLWARSPICLYTHITLFYAPISFSLSFFHLTLPPILYTFTCVVLLLTMDLDCTYSTSFWIEVHTCAHNHCVCIEQNNEWIQQLHVLLDFETFTSLHFSNIMTLLIIDVIHSSILPLSIITGLTGLIGLTGLLYE